MTKEEFLDGLMKALASTGSQSLITENIRFYSSYIDDELSKGRFCILPALAITWSVPFTYKDNVKQTGK